MTANPSPQHNSLVGAFIGELQKRQYQILGASYPGFNAPPKIDRHEPDILSQDITGLQLIAEAKTGDDLTSEHTREQFKDFSNRVMTSDRRRVPFFILVPQGYEQNVRQVLQEEGLLGYDNIYIRAG